MQRNDALARLLRRAQFGGELDFFPPEVAPDMDAWAQGNELEAELIRDLVIGPEPLEDGQGLRIRGACVVGDLDLSGAQLRVGLSLVDCDVRGAVLLSNATIPWLICSGTRMVSLQANNVRILGGLRLDRVVTTTGGIRLRDATVGGGVNLRDGTLVNPGGAALEFAGITCHGSLYLNRSFLARGASPRGAVQGQGATVNGNVSLRGANVVNDSGPALVLDRLELRGNLLCNGGAALSGHDLFGSVQVRGASLGGRLNFRDAMIVNDRGPAIHAGGATILGGVYLNGAFRGEGSGRRGVVRLTDATIRGQVDITGATSLNPAGPSMVASRARISGDLAVDATTALEGELDLSSARAFRLAHEGARWPSQGVLLDGFEYDFVRGTGRREVTEWLALLAAMTSYSAQPYRRLAETLRAAGGERGAADAPRPTA